MKTHGIEKAGGGLKRWCHHQHRKPPPLASTTSRCLREPSHGRSRPAALVPPKVTSHRRGQIGRGLDSCCRCWSVQAGSSMPRRQSDMRVTAAVGGASTAASLRQTIRDSGMTSALASIRSLPTALSRHSHPARALRSKDHGEHNRRRPPWRMPPWKAFWAAVSPSASRTSPWLGTEASFAHGHARRAPRPARLA
jgi:hypothetical protein